MTTAMQGGAPGERISTVEQVRGAIARMREAGPPLAMVWLGLGAVYAATTVIADELGVDTDTGVATWGYLAYSLVSGITGSVGGGIALRLMAGHADWRRIDAGLLAYLAISVAQTMIFVVIMSGLAAIAGPDGGDVSLEQALAGLVLIAGIIAATYAYLKLTLWPVAYLFGRADIGPARSWRLMQKVKRGLVLGLALFGIPLAVVAGLTARFEPAFGGLPITAVIEEFALAAYALATAGLIAEVYERRVAGPSSVADVFD